MNPRVLPVFLSLAFVVCTAAKEAPKALSVRFVAQSVPADLGQVALAFGEQLTKPFDLPVNNLSVPQSPPGRIFKLWAVDKKVPLAAIALPEEGGSFIALLVNSPAGGYTPVLIPAETPSFKGGDIYFFNHANKPVIGYVGKSEFTVKPAQGTIVRPVGVHPDGKFYNVGLGVREPEGDRVLFTGRWPEDSQIRFYVIFYVDPNTTRITYRAVEEFIKPSKPAS